MNRKALLILFLFYFSNYMYSQSLYKTWRSIDYNICLSFDSISQCFIINTFYAEDCKRITFRKKGRKLKVIWRSNQRFFLFGWQRDISWFEIVNLTERTLILTLLSSESFALKDIFYQKTITFSSSNFCEFELMNGETVPFYFKSLKKQSER